MNPIGQLRRRMLGLPARAVRFDERGFAGGRPAIRTRLENIGTTFLAGYHHALECSSVSRLQNQLDSMDCELCGFAYEGAAMALALREKLTPWNSGLVKKFLAGAGDAHTYMIHVGIGWVWARAPFGFRRWQKKLDPLLGWLAFDGWGFHEGFFHWSKFINGEPAPKKLSGYERRVFDQGFGRSLWFVLGADAKNIAQTIQHFAPERRADLWSGVGLAAACAGIVSEAELLHLRQLAGKFQPQLAQGAAFAAKARQRAGNMAPHTQLAAQILCGMSAAAAAQVTDAALENLPADGELPAYEVWRQRIQNQFQKHFAANRTTNFVV